MFVCWLTNNHKTTKTTINWNITQKVKTNKITK